MIKYFTKKENSEESWFVFQYQQSTNVTYNNISVPGDILLQNESFVLVGCICRFELFLFLWMKQLRQLCILLVLGSDQWPVPGVRWWIRAAARRRCSSRWSDSGAETHVSLQRPESWTGSLLIFIDLSPCSLTDWHNGAAVHPVRSEIRQNSAAGDSGEVGEQVLS